MNVFRQKQKAAENSGSLREDLRRMLVLVAGAGLLLAALVYVVFQTVMAYFEAVHDLSHRADMIEIAAAEAITYGNDVGPDLFRGLRTDVELLAGAIYKNDGELFTHYVREPDDTVPPTYQGSLGNRLERGSLVHARPLHLQQTHVGVLYLRAEPHRIVETLVWNLLVGLAVVGVCFGLAYLASFRLKRRIAQPIENLLETARTATADEDYSVRANPTEQSQLGELVQLFNEMLTRVEASDSALKSSSEYFISLVENSRDVIFILENDAKIKFVNAAVTRTLGYDKEQLLGSDIDDLVHKKDRRLLSASLHKRTALNSGGLVELKLRDSEGEWREHEVGITDLRGDPVVQGLVVDCRDISGRLAMERERRQTQEFLHTIFETLPNIVFVKDAKDLRYLRVNRAVEGVLGFSQKDFLHKTDYDLFPTEQADAFRATDRRVLKSGEIEDIEQVSIRGADGQPRILHTRKVPIYHEDGSPRFLLGIAEDITVARRATEAARINEAWYRTMMDYAADPVFIHDLDGRFIEVNQRACDALGYSREELLKMSVPDIDLNARTGDGAPSWHNLPLGEIRTLQGLQLRKDGNTQPIEVRVAGIEVEGTKYVIAISRDISAFLQHEEELTRAMEVAEAANEAKSQFLANINHEMRTPLNAIIGVTELLLANSLSTQQRMQIETISKSSEILLELIEEILDYTTLENREPTSANTEFAVSDVVQTAVSMLAERASDKSLALTCYVDTSVPQRVYSDAGRLRQILINMIGNAIKFTDEGEIIVSVSAATLADGQVELQFEVTDTGCGIQAADQTGIFQPFTQGLASAERRAGGTGLGLTICKRLVTMLGGAIGVRSQPGDGATFWFRFPVEVVDPPRNITVPDQLVGSRALVAIAGERSRAAACNYLKAWGMRPEKAGDVARAKEKIALAAQQGDSYGLCLLDTSLMTTSCAAMLNDVVRCGAAETKFVVLCTTLQAAHECAHCAAAARAYRLVKPLTPLALERALRDVTAKPAVTVESPANEQPVTVGDNSTHHILVAEDNPASQATMLQMLTHLGYESSAVDTGPAVLDIVKNQRFDLLLLDCQLPGMDGYEVASKIRATESGDERLPIVAVSASATIEQRNRCLAAGMDEFLTKPLRLRQLEKLLSLRLEANTQLGNRDATPNVQHEAEVSTLLDEEELAQLRELDSAFADRLAGIFMQDARERLTRLRDALRAQTAATVAREAHALKAGCLQIGAVTMVGLCEELDECAQHACLENAEDLLNALASEFERISVAIGSDNAKKASPMTH